ncbi:hypothetical protein GF325_15650, partial [Candidatus Bathyarchaeota archaeon]|nr:hypothetical protein [Candidatus Bathyarchaeota archaeon]
MFSWLILIFQLLGVVLSLILDTITMLTVNLPIIVSSLVVYNLAFHYKHYKFSIADSDAGASYQMDGKEKAFILIMNGVLLVLGIFSGTFGLFIGTLLLMISAGYLKSMEASRGPGHNWNYLGQALYWISPPLLAAIGFIAGGLFTIIPVVAGVLLFHYWGRNLVDLSLKDTLDRYGWKLFLRIPVTVRYLFVALIFAFPIMVLAWLQVGQVAALEAIMYRVYFLLDPVFLFGVNLPIILVARIFRIVGFRGKYKLNSKENGSILPMEQARYYKLKHVAIIVLGTLLFPLAILFMTYSLLMASAYFREKATNGDRKSSWVQQ